MAYCYSCSVVCLLAIQLAQCQFPGISNAKKHMEAILSNSTRKLLWPETSKRLIAVLFNITFGTLSFPISSAKSPTKKLNQSMCCLGYELGVRWGPRPHLERAASGPGRVLLH